MSIADRHSKTPFKGLPISNQLTELLTMTEYTLDQNTLSELLQTQLTHYLMIEKYGFRAEKNAQSPRSKQIGIHKSELKADLEGIFGEDNEKLIDALFWVLNDAVFGFDPKGWDE